MSNTAIQVEHLSKMYRLGVINNGTLFQDIQTWMALKRGKEDPHSKIGENKYSGDKDHFWALKDVSFEVKQGDRLGIIGKNGAGKSTLLKILSRITTPTEGTVKLKGKVTSLLEVGTGFHAELTGRENIYLNGAILGMKKRRIDEQLDEIIDFSGVEQYIDTPVKRYSSGMYVRLAFAVAAHLESDILISDEVLAVGDTAFQKKALKKMQDLSTSEGRTVLFVSHNMVAMRKLCGSGIIINRGEIQSLNSDINKLIDEYLFDSEKNKNNIIWKNDGALNNSYFIPLSMELQEEDGTKVEFPISSNKTYRVHLSFEVKELAGNNMVARVLILDENQNRLFMSDNIFEEHKPVQGYGSVSFVIPPPVFQFREKYIVSLTVHQHTNFIVNPYINTVSLGIVIQKREKSPISYTW
jgi:lipopolysaccharide transport system ATP-binding protein